MHCISITWSETKDLTTVKFSKKFSEDHEVLQLDILQDALSELQQEYDNIYNSYYGAHPNGAIVSKALGHLPPKQIRDEQIESSEKASVQVRHLSLIQSTGKKPSQP
jgi:hypothetical protein